MKGYCLVMSEVYIQTHFDDIKKYANAIEKRIDDEWCTKESVLEDNARWLERATENGRELVLIDDFSKLMSIGKEDLSYE